MNAGALCCGEGCYRRSKVQYRTLLPCGKDTGFGICDGRTKALVFVMVFDGVNVSLL